MKDKMRHRRIAVLVSLILSFAFLILMGRAKGYPWSSTYTVNVSVCPHMESGGQAWVTLYGNNGYYGHLQTDATDGTSHTVSFPNVPGGKNVYNRIDIDLADGTHAEYYQQRIYNSVDSVVSFSHSPH